MNQKMVAGLESSKYPTLQHSVKNIYELFRLFNKTVITIIGMFSPEKSGPSRINPGISLPAMRNLWSRLGLQQQSSSKRTLVQTSQQPQDLKTLGVPRCRMADVFHGVPQF